MTVRLPLLSSALSRFFSVAKNQESALRTQMFKFLSGAVRISPVGARASVSCPEVGTLEVLNVETRQLEKPIILTKGVDGMAFANIGIAAH